MKPFTQSAALSVLLTALSGTLHAQIVFHPQSYWDLKSQAITLNSPYPPNDPEFQSIDIHRDTYSTAGGIAVTSRANISFFGSVAPGQFRVSAIGFVSGFDTYNNGGDSAAEGSASANLSASSAETMTLSVPGVISGQSAMMRFSYYNSEFIVSGHSVGVSASVGAVIGFTVAGLLPLDSGDSYYVQEYSSPRFDGNNLPANRLFTYQMQVPVGVPFLLTQGLLAQAGARASMGSADFNVASEVYWNGVSEVTLDGTPVTDFSLTNDAGVDFGHSFAPVPEPSHYAALAGTGLLAFALARRIRQG